MNRILALCGAAISVLVFSAGPLSAAGDPTTHPDQLPLSVVRPGHPRIWFNSDTVDLLRLRWADPAYLRIVAKYRGQNDPVSLALEGLATGSAAKCTEAARVVEYSYRQEGDPQSGFVDPISLVFDWCYGFLDSPTKVDLIKKIRVLRDRHRDDPETGVRGFFAWHETFLKSSFAYLASVLAIEGEPGVGSQLREAQNVLQNLQELGDEVSGDGGYQTYFYQGSFQILPFMMWSYATDTDFASRSSFTRNFARWATYKLSPTGRGFIRVPGDDDAFESAYINDPLAAGAFHLIASHFGDPLAQWVAHRLVADFEQTTHWSTYGPSFISLAHAQPGGLARGPAEAGMATTALFDTIGMVHFRSSWDSTPDVIHAWFYNGPGTSHSGESQNHFTVWRGDDPLIMQGGGYLGTPSKYHAHYYYPTVSDNSLLFSPIGSASPDHDGGQSWAFSSSEANAQHYPVAERVGSYSGQHRYRGEINSFQDGGQYAVASGDASPAYNPDHVGMYVRDFVYLKPDLFLIRDRFETTGVATVRSLIHSRERPIFDGHQTVVQGRSNAGIIEARGSQFRLQRGASEAEVSVLWPSSPTLRFVGGAGFEGFADGYNPDPWTDCQDWLKGHWELPERIKLIEGQWRTEIEVTPADTYGSLIHAVFVSGRDPASKPKLSVSRQGADFVVKVVQNGRSRVVLFPAEGAPKVFAESRNSSGRRLAPVSESSRGFKVEAVQPDALNVASERHRGELAVFEAHDVAGRGVEGPDR